MASIIEVPAQAVTTTGSAGSATGEGTISDLGYTGRLALLYLVYHGSAPATTDVIIKDENDVEIARVDNTNTSGFFYPVRQQIDGAVVTAYEKPIVASAKLKATVEGSDALTPAVTVTMYIEKDD